MSDCLDDMTTLYHVRVIVDVIYKHDRNMMSRIGPVIAGITYDNNNDLHCSEKIK